MKKHLISIMLVCMPLMAYAINNNLYIRDARTWNQWDVMVSSVDIKTAVCGLYAYSEMIIVFKDTVSNNNSDSMEVNCTFFIPPESVIDSMSLWINGKPEPAHLLDKWRAWQIYSGIVSIRRDPAFLMVTGNTYTLRIFPFKQREARMVKINFSSPLVPMAGELALRMPLDLIANSLYAPQKVQWEIVGMENSAAADMSFALTEGLSIQRSSRESRPVIIATAANTRVSGAMMCTFRVPVYSDSGYVSSITTEKNEKWFTAIVNVGKVLNISHKRKKKVLFVWNGVQTTISATSREEGNCNYNSELDCHFYNDYGLTSSFMPSTSNNVLESLGKFLGTNLFEGDSFNIITNNGSIRSFSSSGFVSATNEQCLRAASFVLAEGAASARTSTDISTFADLVTTAIQKDRLSDSVIVVIIDQMRYNPYRRNDTTYFYNKGTGNGKTFYHYSMKNTIDIEGLIARVLPQLSGGATVYALINPSQYYGNLQLYDKLTTASGGLIIPINDQEYAFRSLSETMMGKLYPTSIMINVEGESYAYDVSGYGKTSIPIYKPLFLTGKLYGNATAYTIDIKGKFADADYRFNKTLSGVSTCEFAAPREIWAARRVVDLKRENSLISEKEAAALSFKNHILTDYTALLALEPGMDSLLTQKEKAQEGSTTITKEKNDSQQLPQEKLAVSGGRSCLRIVFSAYRQFKGMPMTLKLYDIRGRCVANLTTALIASEGIVELARNKIAKGRYIVRLCIGKTTISKSVTIVD